MRFIDELYEFYRSQFSGEELDAEIVAASVLEELDRKEVIKVLGELDDEELYGLLGFYLVESLKARMARDGVFEGEKPKLH
ncbi:cytosolic protein [Bacillus lacus]|uniref:Cytosolic protein n=1 Tax=Metabacillus lacus TaxID=1983721 RepID=A0A7X2IY16_9BACI|nr:DUF6154 family protein [Metabacillus lacus]MRX71898.1 cytosolic protein [Metabacillus lacus]